MVLAMIRFGGSPVAATIGNALMVKAAVTAGVAVAPILVGLGVVGVIAVAVANLKTDENPSSPPAPHGSPDYCPPKWAPIFE